MRVNKEGLMSSPSRLRVSSATGSSFGSPKVLRSPGKSPSPYRKSKITTSPSPRRGGTADTPDRAAQMSMQEQKQIRAVKVTYEQKKNAVLQEIQVNKAQRFEHIGNKDQVVA